MTHQNAAAANDAAPAHEAATGVLDPHTGSVLDPHLAAWQSAWDVLTLGWSASAASAAVEALDDYLEAGEGIAAERAADLTAFLVGFAESEKQPTAPQWRRLEQLAALLRATFPKVVAPAPAPAPEPASVEAPPVAEAPSPAIVEPPPAPEPEAIPLPVAVSVPVADLAQLRAERVANERTRVCFLGVDESVVPGIVTALAERGFEAATFKDATDLVADLGRARPGALVLEAVRLRALPRINQALGKHPIGSPDGPALVVLSARRDLTERLLAMRAGATAFFQAPLDAYRIVARVEQLLGKDQAPAWRALLVDADREHAALCARWLAEHGMTARIARSGHDALSAMGEFRPDVVLVDDILPDLRGFELTQMLRQQPEFAALPVVLYGAQLSETQRFDGIAAGADEVLRKPLKARHLSAVIKSRIERAQWMSGGVRLRAMRDPQTGLYLRERMIERLGQPPTRRGVALLLVSLDNADRVREAVGLSGLALLRSEVSQAIREVIAQSDWACQLNDYQYLVLVERDHRDQITELGERLRVRIGSGRAGTGENARPLSVSVGIMQLDVPAASADERVARAEAASMAAQRVGGNRVLWWEPTEFSLATPSPELAVRAVLSRPWHEDNISVQFRPLVPLGGKLGGQFDFDFALVSSKEPTARADYALFARIAHELGTLNQLERHRIGCALDARLAAVKRARSIRLFLPVMAQWLLDPGEVDWLVSELEVRKLSGSGFTLEIGSAELLDLREQLGAPLAKLRKAGVRLGLSDYGRDWAAIHIMRTASLDFLRLDPELIEHATSAQATNGTLLALVRKAHQLNAAVIAPNVDTTERAHVLLRLGVDYGAGDGLGALRAEPEFDFNRPIW